MRVCSRPLALSRQAGLGAPGGPWIGVVGGFHRPRRVGQVEDPEPRIVSGYQETPRLFPHQGGRSAWRTQYSSPSRTQGLWGPRMGVHLLYSDDRQSTRDFDVHRGSGGADLGHLAHVGRIGDVDEVDDAAKIAHQRVVPVT